MLLVAFFHYDSCLYTFVDLFRTLRDLITTPPFCLISYLQPLRHLDQPPSKPNTDCTSSTLSDPWIPRLTSSSVDRQLCTLSRLDHLLYDKLLIRWTHSTSSCQVFPADLTFVILCLLTRYKTMSCLFWVDLYDLGIPSWGLCWCLGTLPFLLFASLMFPWTLGQAALYSFPGR